LAQVIKKRNIVIASVLKPVDDTRMFEKIGQSLADSGDNEIHIFGRQSSREYHFPGIQLHPHRNFNRISVYRLTMTLRLLFKIIRLKPAVFIITTHELLLPGLFVKLLSGSRLVYDVQENYFRNILYMNSFPALLKPILAVYVRLKEICLAPFVNDFLLSESAYKDELPFLGSRVTVLENKVRKTACQVVRRKTRSNETMLLFSGTLAESTGVFTAIQLAHQLHAIDPGVHLTIIGYCSLEETLRHIRQAIAGVDFIKLIGGNHLIPHTEIMDAIHESDAGIVSYQPNKSTENKVPTKLYEYIGCQLPVLLVNYTPWVKICEPYPAAVVFNPGQIEAKRLYEELKTREFYTTPPKDEVYWESEAKKLVGVIYTITPKGHIRQAKT
jgi:glycosyltransferase involved in cell wall biosynthesis